MDFREAYHRFLEIVERSQDPKDPELDIRQHVVGAALAPVSVSYRDAVLSSYGGNLRHFFSQLRSFEDLDWQDSAQLFVLGALSDNEKTSHRSALDAFKAASPETSIFFFEQGFLASAYSWPHAVRSADPVMACLGYVYDDLSFYYMSDYPSRLTHKLNSDAELSKEEFDRARVLIDRIVKQQISKYNAQPIAAPNLREGFGRRVLVCDQSFADASTIYGRIDEAGFDEMLRTAIDENPDAEILVKSHPDTSWKRDTRAGYYSHLEDTGRVRILRDPINPFELFDCVDTVYVGSSQMGLEALFAKKRVVCFGAPFYAGWGLTDDRQEIPHRLRSRTLEDVFHYFYIWYTIYHVPHRSVPSSIEDALDFIEDHRPYYLPPTKSQIAAPPKVSVVVPVYNVERYIEHCLTSIQRQTLKEIEIVTVNDCSPDGSQEIIDRLAAADPRFKPIVLSENVGLGFARNAGIEAARGEYIWFLDSDDWMPNARFLERAYRAASSGGVDMARGRKLYRSIDDGTGQQLSLVEEKSERSFDREVATTSLADDISILNSWHCWLWLYRREFLNEIGLRFELPFMEERPFVLKALFGASSLALVKEEATRYRVRPDSITQSKPSGAKSQLFVENFQLTYRFFGDLPTSRKSVFAEHIRFVTTQYLHAFFLGNAYRFFSKHASRNELNNVLSDISRQLKALDFTPDSVDLRPTTLSKRHCDTGAYQLLVAALAAGEYSLIGPVAALKPISQGQLYALQLRVPKSAEEARLQDALNRYARNGLADRQKLRRRKPMSRPRVVIHAGSSKTGSTYLQHIMETNRPALLRAGVWYPEVGLYWQRERPHKQAGHADFATVAVRREAHLRKYIDSGLGWFGDRIHSIILSSEAFFLNDRSDELVDYLDDYDVEMIVYLRRQDEWANSQYVEFVAGGAVGRVEVPIDDWLNDPVTKDRLDYRNHLRRWSRRIGAENVTVRVFERDQMRDGDLLADFAEAARLPELPKIVTREGAGTNEAQLPTPHVDLIRSYNSKPFRSRQHYFGFIEEVTTQTAEWRRRHGKPSPKPWMITDARADALMAQFSEANAEIARTYLNRDDGKLFCEDRRKPREEATLYDAEREIIAEAYGRETRQEEKKSSLWPQWPASATPKIVNYGAFGWRLWALSPLLRMKIARQSRRKSDPGILAEFDREPAEFIRRKWDKKRPMLSKALYPAFDPLGPAEVLRLWVPLLRPIIKRLKGSEEAARFKADPVLFARQQKTPAPRAIGRIFFPNGELRGGLPWNR